MAKLRAAAKVGTEEAHLVYRYLLSTEFRQKVEGLAEAFLSMRNEIDVERAAMERQWAKREDHVRLAILSFAGMIGGIQAISPSFPKVQRLSLSALEDRGEDLGPQSTSAEADVPKLSG